MKRLLAGLLSITLIFSGISANALELSTNETMEVNENVDDVNISEDAIISEGETFNEGEIINQGTKENHSYSVENDDMVATYSSETTSTNSNGVKMTTRNVTPEYHKSSTLVNVEDIIGRYQFNYTGAGTYFDENNCWTNTGYSHTSICSQYEQTQGSFPGNSSGGYLDSSYNEGGEIYKAYLVASMTTGKSASVGDYPITLLYAGEDNKIIKAGVKSKFEYIYYPNEVDAVGWIDVTNFIKENGYGWYYGVNIPFIKHGGDDFSSWKLVVIEKNSNTPIRKLVLNFGNKQISGGQSATLAASGTNITSKKSDKVTGQLLFSESNIDPTNANGDVIEYSMDGSDFKKITTKNGLRTEATPLTMVMSRNGNPIKNYVNWNTHYYYTYAFNSRHNAIYSTTDNSYPEATGNDMELLDITKYTDNHNVVFSNDKPAVYLRMSSISYVLYTEILGICFDIDVPTFEGNQSTKINNSSSVTITGKTINTTKVDGVTSSNGKLTVYLDKGLDAKSATATIHYSDGQTSTITGIIDNTNHTVVFKDVAIYNKDDYVTYVIECTPNKNAGSEFRCSDAFSSSFMNEEVPDLKMDLDTAGASTSTTIPLYTQTINVRYENADGTFTNYETVSSGDKEYGTNMSWSRAKDLTYQAASISYEVTENHIENVTIYRNKYALTVIPNSGKWKDSTSTNKTYTLRVGQTQSIPEITRNGYTFKGWTLSGTGSSFKDSTFTMGTTNASLTANWVSTNYTITYNLNGGSASNPSSYNIETDTFTLSNPTKTGYTFAGWTGSNGTTKQTSVSIAKGSTGNKTYTANWNPINYTITYNLDGGSASNPNTYNIESATFTLNNPTKIGYTFVGWTGSNGTTKQTSVSIAKGSTGNKTYAANYTINQYDVTYIDVIDSTSGTQLGKTTKKVNYNSNVRGSDLGNSTCDNAYHNGYYYVSDTSAIVSTNGATVYRIFKLRTVDKTSNLTWNDNNNKNGFRPSKYTLKLLRNGSVFKQVDLQSSQTSYTFNNLNKYDSNGKTYTYTFQVDANSDRYKMSIDGNGNITEDYQNSTFSVIIPKNISLNGNTGKGSYNIKVDGTFYYNDTLTVVPSNSFKMIDKSGISNINASVSQDTTTFTKSNLASTKGTISLSKAKFAGSYTGTFNFAIKFTMKN